MRYKRAVEKLRLLVEGCEEIGYWPPWDEPYLVEMYAFGGVLEGLDPLEEVQVVGVIPGTASKSRPWTRSPNRLRRTAAGRSGPGR